MTNEFSRKLNIHLQCEIDDALIRIEIGMGDVDLHRAKLKEAVAELVKRAGGVLGMCLEREAALAETPTIVEDEAEDVEPAIVEAVVEDVVEDAVENTCCGKWAVHDAFNAVSCSCARPVVVDTAAIDEFIDDYDALFGQRLAA